MKSDLFIFGEEIIRITIQHHFTDALHRNQLFWDQLGRVEQVKIELEFVFFRNELQPQFVFRIIACFNSFPQIAAMKIGITTGKFLRFIPYQRSFARQRFPVKTDKGGFPLRIYQPERVNAKAFHRAIAAWNTPVRHRPYNVVQRFWL